MYTYLDRLPATLDPGSRFMLWAIRTAATTMAHRRCLGAALGAGFAHAQIAPALPHFAIATAVLLRESNRSIALMSPGCAPVCEDEAILLALYAAADSQGDERVLGALAHIIESEDARQTVHKAMRMVTAYLLEAGVAPASSCPETDS